MGGKEKAIIFNTDMVRAILEGRKTMDRRVMKPAKRNHRGFKQGDGLWIDGYKAEDKPNGHIKDYSVSSAWQRKDYYIKEFAPYKPGDILWVRETWAARCDECDSNQGTGYKDATCAYGDCNRYVYKADDNGCPGGKWRPSTHMPREAARLFLKVTSVKVERVQDITPKNIAAEGLPSFICHPEHEYYKNVCGDNWLGFEWFRELWDGINSKRGYGWDTNPWVWVIEFEKISKEEAER